MHVDGFSSVERSGLVAGYALSYFLFTTVLFVLLLLLKKHTLAYPQVMLLTGSIALLGIIIKRALK